MVVCNPYNCENKAHIIIFIITRYGSSLFTKKTLWCAVKDKIILFKEHQKADGWKMVNNILKAIKSFPIKLEQTWKKVYLKNFALKTIILSMLEFNIGANAFVEIRDQILGHIHRYLPAIWNVQAILPNIAVPVGRWMFMEDMVK